MLKPAVTNCPRMTLEERRQFEATVAEEMAAGNENIAAAKRLAPPLLAINRPWISWVACARREVASVSLAQLEERSGSRKSVFSRLEIARPPIPLSVRSSVTPTPSASS